MERVKTCDSEDKARLASVTKDRDDKAKQLGKYVNAEKVFKHALHCVASFALGVTCCAVYLYLASAPCSRCDVEYYQYQYK